MACAGGGSYDPPHFPKAAPSTSVAVTPSHQVVYEGTEASIECETKNAVNWTKNGKPLPSRIIIAGAVLTIASAEFGDSGRYSCHSSIDKYGKKKYTIHSKLIVAGS